MIILAHNSGYRRCPRTVNFQHSSAWHGTAAPFVVQEAEKNAAECVLRKLRQGRGDAGNLGMGEFVGPLGYMEEIVNCLLYTSDAADE